MTIKYDPQHVTDWLTPLEKVYARQSAQLDRYHGQLRERDRQEEEATIDLPEVFSKLANFSTSISSAVNKNKAKRQTKQRGEVENVFNTASSMQELRDINKDYKLKKKGLLENWDKYEELILASTKLTDEQKSYALKTSPRRQLVLKEVLAQSVVSNLENSWQEDFKNMTGKEQDAFELLNFEGKNDYRREWVDKKLEGYKYSDGFLLENIQPERDRFLSTKNKLTAIKAKDLKFTQDQAEFEAEGDQYNLTGTAEQRGAHNLKYVVKHSALNSDPNSEDTPTQQGVQKWMVAQSKILRKGEDSLGDLEKILNSKVKHKGHVTDDNPEGWTTFEKAFLSKDQVAQLTRDANIGVNTKWEREKATTEFSQKSFLQQVQTGQVSKEQWSAEIDRLEKLPNANKELIKELKELDPDAQSADVEAILTEEWDERIENGLYGITEEDIEAIPNYNVKQKAKEKWAQLQKAEIKHGTSKGDMDSTVHSARTKIPWAGKLNDPIGKEIALELDKAGEAYRASLIYAQYAEGKYTPDPEIGTKTLLFKQALWESRGGGTEGKDGRYSVDVMEGKFKNFITATRTRIRANDSHNLKYTVENGDTWAKDLQTNMSAFKTPEGDFDYQSFIESGLAYSKQDLIGTLTNGDYSEKMEYIADYLNTDVETLFKSSLEEVKKDEDFARRWDLDKLEDPIDTQIRDDLDRAFARYDGDSMKTYQLKDLKYVMRKGWKNLSNKQKTRVYNLLAENSTLSEAASADAEKTRQEADQTLATKNQNKRIQDALAIQAKRQAEQEELEEQAEQLQDQIEGLWTP